MRVNTIARDNTNKIVRQHQTKEGTTYTQWSDGNITVHLDNSPLDSRLATINYLPYIKETDYESYPQYKLFMECIARDAYHMNYMQARIKGLLPPLPPPVIKPKDYRKRKESVNEDE